MRKRIVGIAAGVGLALSGCGQQESAPTGESFSAEEKVIIAEARDDLATYWRDRQHIGRITADKLVLLEGEQTIKLACPAHDALTGKAIPGALKSTDVVNPSYCPESDKTVITANTPWPVPLFFYEGDDKATAAAIRLVLAREYTHIALHHNPAENPLSASQIERQAYCFAGASIAATYPEDEGYDMDFLNLSEVPTIHSTGVEMAGVLAFGSHGGDCRDLTSYAPF